MAVKEVLANRQVRKQRQILRHIAHATMARWHLHTCGCVGHHKITQLDESRSRPTEPGDEVEQGSFPGAGRAEYSRDLALHHRVGRQGEFGERQGIQIEFKSGEGQISVAPEIGLCLFRVLQEALHNAAKHSEVKRIEVQLHEESGEVHLIVSDSGRGFDVEAVKQGRGLGLTSMQERVRLVNGTIEIQSKPMAGPSVHVRVPLGAEHDSQRVAG